jgi:hypothetical protein
VIQLKWQIKKMAVRFLRTSPRRGLCWDENSKDHRGLHCLIAS